VARLEKQDFTPAVAKSLIAALSAEAPSVAGAGVHSAEILTMSLDALAAALTNNSPKTQTAMAQLYGYLEHPSVYNPAEFTALFQRVVAQVN
jgi:hypothetical protein